MATSFLFGLRLQRWASSGSQITARRRANGCADARRKRAQPSRKR